MDIEENSIEVNSDRYQFQSGQKSEWQSRLIESLYAGNMETAKAILEDKKEEDSLWNIRDNKYEGTLLHWAAASGYGPMLELVATYYTGQGLNEIDKPIPVLQWAVSRDSTWTSGLLLDKYASLFQCNDPMSRDLDGQTALHVACSFGRLYNAALLLAYMHPNSLELLKAKDKNGRTALHVAAAEGYCDVATYLIQYGRDDFTLMKDNSGNTALHLAVLSDRLDVSKEIVRNSPKSAEEIDESGKTPYELVKDSNKKAWKALKLDSKNWTNSVWKIVKWLILLIVPATFLPSLIGTMSLLGLSTQDMRIKAILLTTTLAIFSVVAGLSEVAVRKISNLPSAVSNPILFLYHGAFILQSLGVYLYVAINSPTSYGRYTFIQILLIGLSVAIITLFILLVRSNPGYLEGMCPIINKNVTIKLAQEGLFERSKSTSKTCCGSKPEVGYRFCIQCNVIRWDTTRHCRYCNQCVEKFDHHCPWIYNCVGGNNILLFCGYLLVASIGCLFCFLVILKLHFRDSVPGKKMTFTDLFVVGYLIMLIAVCISTFLLFIITTSGKFRSILELIRGKGLPEISEKLRKERTETALLDNAELEMLSQVNLSTSEMIDEWIESSKRIIQQENK